MTYPFDPDNNDKFDKIAEKLMLVFWLVLFVILIYILIDQ
jgi:hypothetical protein